MANPVREELAAAVAKIQSPTLVVVGDLDPRNPAGVSIGRGCALYASRCPASNEHPHATVMQ